MSQERVEMEGLKEVINQGLPYGQWGSWGSPVWSSQLCWSQSVPPAARGRPADLLGDL